MDESIGARLRRAREQRRLTIEEVSEATKVRPHYLEALEGDDLSALASTAQARGFLRIYAAFLGLGNGDLNPQRQPQDEQASPKTTESATASLTRETSESRPSLLSRLRQRMSRGGGAGAQTDLSGLSDAGAPGSGSAVTVPEAKKKALS